MKLEKVRIKQFKSIEDSGEFSVDPEVTVLVGMNEAGKSATLQAILKSGPADDVGYDVTLDYPRKSLNEYRHVHETAPAEVLHATYRLTEAEIEAVSKDIGFQLAANFQFTLNHNYADKLTITISANEAALVKHTVDSLKLTSDTKAKMRTAKNIQDAIAALPDGSLSEEEQSQIEPVKTKYVAENTWVGQPLANYIWRKYLSPQRPSFLYFDDYKLLEGKINLQALTRRAGAKQLLESDRTALSLLRMAGVTVEDFANPAGYEDIKAKLEGLSNSITDRIFKYWKQNRELDVEFDIREDSKDIEPFNQGRNLYIRIRNRRHRVTVPFSQRSKGFIWFFSFIVWFDSVKANRPSNSTLVLLLDEPGLSLHALAQSDFLAYIDDLSKQHQTVYTTHSPFMVRPDRLSQVRVVEDQAQRGTVVTDHLGGSDPKTLFPLQAALGYTIAQNLFISERNLLVEGPADLIYLRHLSDTLVAQKRVGLRDDVTVVPAGGLDKVATFVALLGANKLQLAILHDYSGQPDQRIGGLVRDKMIQERSLLSYALFRGKPVSGNPIASDVEDLFEVGEYLELFHSAYKKQLGTDTIKESDLPPGDRIVLRIEAAINKLGLQLRPSGGFNHYLPAQQIHNTKAKFLSTSTLKRFEDLFVAINSRFV